MEAINQPRVGIGVMIMKKGKVLLAKRKGSHGAGEYAFPGGHLEYNESFQECAERETDEECGVSITNIRFQFLANITTYPPKCYTHVNLLADWKAGLPIIKEPNKAESWDWYSLEDLPKPMFASCILAIDSYRTGQNYYDIPAVNDLLKG